MYGLSGWVGGWVEDECLITQITHLPTHPPTHPKQCVETFTAAGREWPELKKVVKA